MSDVQYLKMDEEGFFVLNDGLRLENEELGLKWMRALRTQDSKIVASIDGRNIIVEPFDEALVIHHIETLKNNSAAKSKSGGELKLIAPYGFSVKADLDSLCLDEWDRLHGLTDNGVPFVLSRTAQFEFFEQLEDYDDDSITWNGKKIPTPAWLNPADFDPANQFWSDLYAKKETPWDQAGPHPALKSILPQLKLAKQKVLVPGCGRGHDAAMLAEQGHIVTALDFSAEAITEAKKLYGHVANLTFVQADVFDFCKKNAGTFDLVFEHTLYCAMDPKLRNDLVRAWTTVLQARGQVLAVFFAMPKRLGPPFGGSEWELRERLKKSFHFIYWTRWHLSSEARQGLELVVLAQKLNQ